MLSNTLDTIVQAAVMTELADAKRTHGEKYASPHEGYGVLMEELHEATVELRDLDSAITEQLIEDVHANDLEGIVCTLADVELTARHLACEAIQVAAVARKLSEACAAMLLPSSAKADATSLGDGGFARKEANASSILSAPPPKVTITPEQLLTDAAPAQRFLLVLRELLNAGECMLLDLRDAFPTDYIPACYMGFHDRDRFYLFPQRIYDKVEEVLQARGLSLGVSCKKLCQMLRDEKLVIPDGSYPCKGKHIGGKSYRLLWIPKQVVREADGRG